MDRKTFTKSLLATVSSFSLMDTLFANAMFPSPIQPIVTDWLKQLNDYCFDLKQEAITPLEWQHKIEELYAKIQLEELLQFIEFDNLSKGFSYPNLGVATKPVKFPRLKGLPEKTVFYKKIFGMKKNRSIIPHGHSNMASAHMILKGQLHMRHYDKIRQEDNHLIINPTVDKQVSEGDYSSISDDKDNVHWFVANTDAAFTFDIIMLDLNGASYDVHNLDIYNKENLNDGNIRVPILDVESALKKYGKSSHH